MLSASKDKVHRPLILRGKVAVISLIVGSGACLYLQRNISTVLLFASNTGKSNAVTYEHSRSVVVAMRQKRQASCRSLQILGTNGVWLQDWEFATEYGQHPSPRNIPYGPFAQAKSEIFQPSLEAPFPWETSWRWVDFGDKAIPTVLTENQTNHTNMSSLPHPPRTEQIDFTISASPTKICATLHALGIRSMLFLGDSLQEYQYISLINMLGNSSRLFPYPRNKLLRRHSLHCGTNTSGDIQKDHSKTRKKKLEMDYFVLELEFIRVHSGKAYPESGDPHRPLIFTNETQELFIRRKDPMLVVFNIGPHYHNTTLYERDVDHAREWFQAQTLYRPKEDVYYFRTTVPGHKFCHPQFMLDDEALRRGQRVVPYRSYDEYAIHNPVNFVWSQYMWHLFEGYNEYVKGTVGDIFRIFDVFNLTVLRQDGHLGGTDCLHYRYGIGDWWNHLLFTKLQLMAQCAEA